MRTVITLLLIVLTLTARAQAPGWEWAKQAKGILVGPSDIAADAFGNIYVTGQLDSTARFDNQFIASIPNQLSYNDIFLAKYTNSGDLLWVKRVAPNTGSYRNAIAVDGEGNAYVTGALVGPEMIGPVLLSDTGLYIVKYKPSGDVAWAKQITAFPVYDNKPIVCDEYGNLYLTGTFHDHVTLGGQTFTTTGDYDMFLAKLNSNGDVLWAKTWGGAYDQRGHFFTVNREQLFVSYDDALLPYISKLDTAGNKIWTIPAYCDDMVADADGNLYTVRNGNEGLVTKYDSNGGVIYTKNVSFNAAIKGLKYVALDNSSARNVYVAGFFDGNGPNKPLSWVEVGSLKLQTTEKHTDFVMQLKNDGEPVWAQAVYGAEVDYTEVQALEVDGLGNVYIAGQMGGNCAFDAQTLVMDTADAINLYFAKLGSTTSVQNVQTNAVSVAVYPNPTTGNVTIDLAGPASEIILNDITGRPLHTIRLSAAQKQVGLNMAGFTDGVYYLQVMSDAGTVIKRVVLSR